MRTPVEPSPPASADVVRPLQERPMGRAAGGSEAASDDEADDASAVFWLGGELAVDFANERYVRLYTRETTTWRLLGWQGQALLPQLLRMVDRSGVLDLAGATPTEAVAAGLPGWPVEVVDVGLSALIARGVVKHIRSALVWGRFLEAQECAMTDAQRAREMRARRRDQAGASHNVTDAAKEPENSIPSSRPVTPSHSVSLQPCFTTPPLPATPEEEPTAPSRARARDAATTDPPPAPKRQSRKRQAAEPAVPWPAGWTFGEAEAATARKYGAPTDEAARRAWEAFEAWAASKGATYARWPAAWATRCMGLRDGKYGQTWTNGNGNGNGRRVETQVAGAHPSPTPESRAAGRAALASWIAKNPKAPTIEKARAALAEMEG